MKKKCILIFSTIMVLIVVSLLLLKKGNSVNFDRIRIHTPDTIEVEEYQGKAPGFLRIKYSEGDRIHIDPDTEGERGILLSLNAVKKKGSVGGISINILRENIILSAKSEVFRKRRLNLFFKEKFRFKKGDKLEILFSGSGSAVLREPVIYEIKDPEERKHVFVIALDNLRYDRIGKKINGVDLTPNLNKFKKDSVSFSNGFSQSSWTLPAFTSFFTGLYEFNHGITRESVLSGDIPLFTEYLARKFVTVSINGGVWLAPGITDHRGFDLSRLGSRTKDVNAAENFFKYSMRFLEENEIPELFMFMHTFSIHAPYYPPERFLYELDKNPKYKFMKALTHDKQFQKGVPEEERIGRELLYDADVKAFDFYFGKFIEYLKVKKIYNQSLIVFLSDHGEEFYEHGGWFHGHSLYNEIIRIPIIFKFPGNRYAGIEINDLAGIIDVLPTLGDFLGVNLEENGDGVSLMPMIKGESFPARILISSTTKCQIGDRSPKTIAILKGKYKYLYNIDNVNRKGKRKVWKTILDRGKYELYDLMMDPGELNNLWTKRPDLAGMFIKELKEIMKKVVKNLNFGIIKKKMITESDKEKLRTLGYL